MQNAFLKFFGVSLCQYILKQFGFRKFKEELSRIHLKRDEMKHSKSQYGTIAAALLEILQKPLNWVLIVAPCKDDRVLKVALIF